jgi:hypothetical protein
VHVAALPDEQVPYVVSYVDVIAGPRVLARSEGAAAFEVGADVELIATSSGSLGVVALVRSDA